MAKRRQQRKHEKQQRHAPNAVAMSTVDTQLGGPSYVVVDAGGWFTSKYFLLPMKNAQLDSATPAVTADLTREEVREFPGFDKDEFSSITDDELGRLTSRSA